MRAIGLLSFWKLRNAIRTVLSDPRKLIPFGIALLIILAMVGLATIDLGKANPNLTHDHLDPRAFQAGATLCLILLGLSFIDSGLGDSLLALGMADVDYLFPSPISRRFVLAFRIPALLFSALFMAGFVLMAFNLTTSVARPQWPNMGHTAPPGWAAPTALFLSGGIYMNFAMTISVRINDRRLLHRALMAFVFGIAGFLGLLGWLKGLGAVESLVESPFVRWTFLPSSLACDSLVAGYSLHPALQPLEWLALGYFISLGPLFTSNANWYEQSIVSSERVSAFRQAARGGYSSLVAAKAAGIRRANGRDYTVRPFGRGAMALFWAHLCAATKSPFGNFLGPALGGIGAGAFSAFATSANKDTENIGFAALFGIALYCSMGFMASAKTACEAAIRRRELLSPLPIAGWKAVAANLAVPFCTAFLFFASIGVTYGIAQAPNWPLIVFTFVVGLPLRLIARMILQYIVGLGYPDVADKIQQFFAIGIYAMATSPFLATEVLLCIPGLILHSIWTVIIALTAFQLPLTAILLTLAGKAAEKAIATGEPVRITSLLPGRR